MHQAAVEVEAKVVVAVAHLAPALVKKKALPSKLKSKKFKLPSSHLK
jgi:hypothetical protein